LIDWLPATSEDVLPPPVARALLQRSLQSADAGADPCVGLGNVYRDAYDFKEAARWFGEALRRDPSRLDARLKLARCLNVLRRSQDSLDVLDGIAPDTGAALALQAEAHALRGIARVQLGHLVEAERELRTALELHAAHPIALLKLSKILRERGDVFALRELCETLAARGHRHARLLLDWGRALALTGERERSRCLLMNPRRIAERRLGALAGFSDVTTFNRALAEEILSNPYPIGDFPEDEEANRGSSRVHHLMAGRRPELVRALLRAIEQEIAALADDLRLLGSFDPWVHAVPAKARLKAWGLIQRQGMYEAWHTHPGGWLSGVYYVSIPPIVSAEGEGRGCIEFGPPPSLAVAMPDLIAPRRYLPQEGMILMAPSHYHHRTIPTGADEHRISFAFDVVPDE
jgi:Flp pilus assembly protein TadD